MLIPLLSLPLLVLLLLLMLLTVLLMGAAIVCAELNADVAAATSLSSPAAAARLLLLLLLLSLISHLAKPLLCVATTAAALRRQPCWLQNPATTAAETTQPQPYSPLFSALLHARSPAHDRVQWPDMVHAPGAGLCLAMSHVPRRSAPKHQVLSQ